MKRRPSAKATAGGSGKTWSRPNGLSEDQRNAKLLNGFTRAAAARNASAEIVRFSRSRWNNAVRGRRKGKSRSRTNSATKTPARTCNVVEVVIAGGLERFTCVWPRRAFRESDRK